MGAALFQRGRDFLVLLIILLLWSREGFGAFSNYNSILIGEASAGMGGAYTAMYGDVAGSLFYNPAGLSWNEGNSFSSSVSIYKKFDTIMGRYEDIVKAPLRISQGYFQSIPSSSGSVFKYRDYFVGLSVVVPDYTLFKGIISSNGNNDSVLSFIDESLWVGGALSKKITETQSLGITLYYTARNYNRTVQDRTVNTTDNTLTSFSEEKNIVGNSVVAVLGYQWHWTEDFFLGASVRLPSLEVSSSGSYFKNIVSADGGAGSVSLDTASHPDEKSHTHIPAKISLGAVYIWKDWTISVDGSLYGAERYYDFQDNQIRSLVHHRMMVNGALGVSYQYSPQFILRSGWFTNLTSHEDLELSDKYGDRVDQLGWAANLTYITKEKINFTFGGYYSGGIGKSVQRIDQQYQIIPETQQVFTMLLGTSFSF